MKFRKILLSIAFFLGVFSVSASEPEEFFSTEPADQLFSFGARLGINASNRTFPSNVFNKWNSNSWGTGMDVGAIANINFRDYLSVQPGIFFESRSGNFSYVFDDIYQLGHPIAGDTGDDQRHEPAQREYGLGDLHRRRRFRQRIRAEHG